MGRVGGEDEAFMRVRRKKGVMEYVEKKGARVVGWVFDQGSSGFSSCVGCE